MEVILKQDIEGLGHTNDIIRVKNGYGRNYLIPKGLVILATPSAKKILNENIKQRAHKEAKLKEEAEGIAKKLQELSLTIGAKTSSKGKIFGSVNTIQLAEELSKSGFDIDRKDIRRHMGFATGPHSCLGSHLARAEARISLEQIFSRLPNWHMDPDNPSKPVGYEFRQPHSMHLLWDC